MGLQLTVDKGATQWCYGIFSALYPIISIFVLCSKLDNRPYVYKKPRIFYYIFCY
jgi:hypothetical protein